MGLLLSGSIIIFVFGTVLGSFTHCWAQRLHSGQGFKKRSHCPHCQRLLDWWENIPVFSYLRLGGRCRSCQAKIPSHYFWTEMVSGCLLLSAWLVLWFRLGETEIWAVMNSWQGWLVVGQAVLGLVILLLVFLTDYWWMSIFVQPVMISALVLMGLNWLSGQPIQSLLLGGLVGGLFFALQYWLSRGRWIGEGDIYLGIMLGAWLGWPLILLTIFIAYLAGAMVGVLLMALGRKEWTAKLPLGVFLAPSGWLIFLVGQSLWNIYLTWLGY